MNRWVWAGLLAAAVPLWASEETHLGITSPIRDATLGCVAPGRVDAVRVEKGQFVRRGEILVRLDQRLETLEAERRKLIWESRLELDAAAAKAETLHADYVATRTLHERTGSISREDVAQSKLAADIAEAERAALELAEKREELEYHMAGEQVDRKVIRAPWDGWVIEQHIEEGETCEKGRPVLRIVDTRRCHLTVNLEARTALKLRIGQQVRLLIDPEGVRYECAGVVDFISPVVDPASGLQTVRAVFENEDARIRPGVFGTILLEKE